MCLHAKESRIVFPDKKIMLEVLGDIFATKTLINSFKITIFKVMVPQNHNCPEASHATSPSS